MAGQLLLGSIPAHAGKPCLVRRCYGNAEVDPRACGEAVRSMDPGKRNEGRSPRMRGSHRGRGASGPLDGSIPAHAGKPGRSYPAGRRVGVDPRACGEARLERRRYLARRGRSPRMRGSRPGACCCNARRRSIPAHAGKPV